MTMIWEVSGQVVGKWVNDKRIPEVGKIVQISNLFGVSTDYLLKRNSTFTKRLADKDIERCRARTNRHLKRKSIELTGEMVYYILE